MANVYTADEVACHNDAMDLWIVIHGNVYDVTSFLKQHPGGEDVLLELAGQDGTDCFDSIGHSSEALQLQKEYKIGEVVGGVGVTKSTMNKGVKKTYDNDDEASNQQRKKSKQDSSKLKMILIAFLLIYIINYLFNII